MSALITLLVIFLLMNAIFKVESVVVTGNDFYPVESIVEASGVKYGSFFFSFSASEAENAILRRCPYVEKASIHREYPDTVVIEVTEYKARYLTHQADKYIVFSPELKVLEVSSENKWNGQAIMFELPAISVAIEGRDIVFTSESKTDYITEFIRSLGNYTSDKTIGVVDLRESHNLKMVCGVGYEIHFGKSAELDVKMRTLSKLLASERIKETLYARIDMTNPKEPSFVPIKQD